MSEFVEQLGRLPVLLAWHVVLTVVAVGVGVLIAVPVGVLGRDRAWVRGPGLAVASVVQTVPGLALLALVFALLVVLRDLLAGWVGWVGFSALGFWPTVIALSLYAVLPVLRNVVTGLRGVDGDVVEAARGLGMSRRQVLCRVEWPLALPVVLAGVRTAVVWTVGVATLSTAIGQKSLGDYIFAGLQTFNLTGIVVGCVAAAGLALGLDALWGWVERGGVRRVQKRVGWGLSVWLGLGVVALGLLIGLGEVRFASRPAEAGGPGEVFELERVRIGAKNFNEQFMLARVIERRVEAAGYDAERVESLGSLNVFEALAAGELDVYVDYSGTIWANAMGREPGLGREAVLREMTAWLLAEKGIVCLGSLGFENAYALAMREDDAERLGVRTIDDLVRHAPALRIGSDIEFFERPEWAAVRDGYGLRFADQRPMVPTLMYPAITSGEVDVITAFTSDGRIMRDRLRLLMDTKGVFPPYDAVVLVSERASRDERLVEVLRGLVGSIELGVMQRANAMVDVEGKSVGEAAGWLVGEVVSDE
ncbi:MAG: glycine betaine ABC transporter substrate-binding protein [Planctomycetota bacterium]